jgi:serine/threonine protein phosphatase 1
MISWFRRRAAPTATHRAAVPPGRRVYAIGDIHGRADLLEEMHRRIGADARRVPGIQPVVVYLGDYVDRGMNSREVIDILLHRPLEGFQSVHLLGNHEAILLQFLVDTTIAPTWFNNGGNLALFSYGVHVPPGERDEARLRAAQADFAKQLPDEHLKFLRSLKTSHLEGDYLFVHAGIRPGVSIPEQNPRDLIWIRGEFLNSMVAHPKVVVHGHSTEMDVQVLPNRIGIDTGAYYSGRLTALVLEGETRRFITT